MTSQSKFINYLEEGSIWQGSNVTAEPLERIHNLVTGDAA